MDDIAKNREDFWKNIHDNYYTTNTGQGKWRKVYLRDVVRKNKIDSVLELGCNSGGNLLCMIHKNPHLKATGIDICDKAIRHGREVEQNPANLMVKSIYDLSDFLDNSFDLVFTSCVLIHIPPDKVEGILKEMKRICKYFVVNIEHHSDEGMVMGYSVSFDTPHRWAHNYDLMYKNIGKLQRANMIDIAKHTEGGDDHFMWHNKTERQLEII